MFIFPIYILYNFSSEAPRGYTEFQKKISWFWLRGISIVYRAHNTPARTQPQLYYARDIQEKHSPKTASSAAPSEQIPPSSGW